MTKILFLLISSALICFGLTHCLGFYQDILNLGCHLKHLIISTSATFFDVHVIYANKDGYVFFCICIRGIKAASNIIAVFLLVEISHSLIERHLCLIEISIF